MKIKDGEEIIKEYYFSKTKDDFHKGILTNFRLVFATNSSEENYPLSKLTSVRTEKEKSGFRSKVLGFSALAMVILLIVTGFMIFGENNPNWEEISYLIPIYLILIWLIRFGLKPDKVTTNLVILIWLIRFGLKPDKVTTNLVITQMGGTKRYTGLNNKNLQEFIDKINEQLI